MIPGVGVLRAGMLLLALAAAACGPGTDAELPNPAAVFCEERGGTVSGPEPMCTLADGSTVDAWDYYRREGPDAVE